MQVQQQLDVAMVTLIGDSEQEQILAQLKGFGSNIHEVTDEPLGNRSTVKILLENISQLDFCLLPIIHIVFVPDNCEKRLTGTLLACKQEAE